MFDPAALCIGEAEAALMDPQQRLLLETASEAMLAHPAEAADEQLRSNWGVFVVSGLDVTKASAAAYTCGIIDTSHLLRRVCLPTTITEWHRRTCWGRSPPTVPLASRSAWSADA